MTTVLMTSETSLLNRSTSNDDDDDDGDDDDACHNLPVYSQLLHSKQTPFLQCVSTACCAEPCISDSRKGDIKRQVVSHAHVLRSHAAVYSLCAGF